MTGQGPKIYSGRFERECPECGSSRLQDISTFGTPTGAKDHICLACNARYRWTDRKDVETIETAEHEKPDEGQDGGDLFAQEVKRAVEVGKEALRDDLDLGDESGVEGYVDTLSITECACVAAGLRERKANGHELTEEEEKILELAHERTGEWLRDRGKLGDGNE